MATPRFSFIYVPGQPPFYLSVVREGSVIVKQFIFFPVRCVCEYCLCDRKQSVSGEYWVTVPEILREVYAGVGGAGRSVRLGNRREWSCVCGLAPGVRLEVMARRLCFWSAICECV